MDKIGTSYLKSGYNALFDSQNKRTNACCAGLLLVHARELMAVYESGGALIQLKGIEPIEREHPSLKFLKLHEKGILTGKVVRSQGNFHKSESLLGQLVQTQVDISLANRTNALRSNRVCTTAV